MAKTEVQKLGYEDREFTTVDRRTFKMGDYFLPDDFAIDERSGAFIKHDALLRVLKKLFVITNRLAHIEKSPEKSNEWCATVTVTYEIRSENKDEKDGWQYYSWTSTADARTSNSMPGMERYTTCMAETRASGRALRQLLGVEFCTKEELAEKTVDVEHDDSPIKPNTVMMIEKKFMGQNGITLEQMGKLIKKPELTSVESLTVAEGAELVQKLHRNLNKLIEHNTIV